MATELPLVVIVGPTASGKTALALDLAERWNGEIICADSRTIYKGMDIGTAKPTPAERARVPHWGLDLISPNERFNAAAFQRYANDAIRDIRKRHKIPFLVGGTGLYIDSVIYNYDFPAPPDESLRAYLSQLSEEELIHYCVKNNIELPQENKNIRRLIRQAAGNGGVAKKSPIVIPNTIIVGLEVDKTILHQRMAQRAEQMLYDGLVEETKKLGDLYGWNSEAMTGNAYRIVKQALEQGITESELSVQLVTRDRQLAKRQMTWFRRNNAIQWLSPEVARAYLDNALAF